MRLVGWLSASGRPENFPGCNRHVTANLGPEMRDLTRELGSRCENSASHALKSCARGSFRPRRRICVEILSKVRRNLEVSKTGDESVLRTHVSEGCVVGMGREDGRDCPPTQIWEVGKPAQHQ